MKPLRRLDVAPKDLYGRLRRGALHDCSLSEAALREIERERPELIAVEGASIVVAEPRHGECRLHYTFPDCDAFARLLPDLLARLLPALNALDAPFGVRLRLTERTSRPWVEPVLRANAFERTREWLEMTLTELPSGVVDDSVAPGFLLRQARAEDAEAIAELDAVSFPVQYMTPPAARALAEEAPVFRVLEDTSAGRAAGFLHLDVRRGSTGHIVTVALRPEYRRRGLGEALMRWALAWFHAQGLRRAQLTVSVDNGPAIALYRKLGFDVSRSGIDYRRPIDEEEARQVLEKQRASHITVRRRI